MEETDERIEAWHQIAAHPYFESAYRNEGPLIDSMIEILDRHTSEMATEAATQAEEPVEWRLLRAFTNGYAEGMRRAIEGRLDR